MSVEEFRLPDVGEGIAEAEIISWYVEVGQPVRRDQPLVAIETDKSLLDIPSPCDGTLLAQGAPPGTVLPVGAVLARIDPAAGTAGGAPAGALTREARPGTPATAAHSGPPDGVPATGTATDTAPTGTGTTTGAAPTATASGDGTAAGSGAASGDGSAPRTGGATTGGSAPRTGEATTGGSAPAAGGGVTDGDAAPVGAGGSASAAGGPGRSRPLASPATRRLARRLGVDLASVTGTGPAGRVTRADVERAAEPARWPAAPSTSVSAGPSPVPPGSPAPAPEPADPGRQAGPTLVPADPGTPVPPPTGSESDRVVALRGVRRRIAQVMSAAAQVPTIYDWREVDATALTRAVESLRRHHREGAPRIDLLTIVARAVVTAVRAHPHMNATYDPQAEQLTIRGGCHLGIATATEDGLLVPVVRDAHQHSMVDLAGAIADLTSRARRRELTPAETGGGTITISNFGALGSSFGTPLLRVPEVTIVGIGRIADRVVAVDGQPAVRPVLPLSVATDHRVNDGAHLAAFCATLAELLADPVLLLAGV